jgi:hypothetical protein
MIPFLQAGIGETDGRRTDSFGVFDGEYQLLIHADQARGKPSAAQ